MALALASACGAAAGAEPSAIQSYYYFVHWVSMSRLDLALEQFTNHAVVVAGPVCTASTPCVGKAAIQAGYLEALRAGHASLPMYDQRFDGQQLRTRGEEVLERGHLVRASYVFEFQGGRIESLRLEPDLSLDGQ